jgi:hypothetical protein
MYRYFLFYYDTYYPHGGMEDCVLKTNNFDDLEQFIHENYEDDYFQGTISYYDDLEDKTWYADMEDYDDENYFSRWRFLGWTEEQL